MIRAILCRMNGGHRWVDVDGKPFTVETVQKGKRRQVVTTEATWDAAASEEEDRACARCMTVELNRTGRAIAATKLRTAITIAARTHAPEEQPIGSTKLAVVSKR